MASARHFRARSVRFHRDDRREGRNLGCGLRRPKAGPERDGPDKLFVLDHFKVAADVGKFLALRRAHDKAEDAAGAKIDFAIDRLPGCRREPFLDVLGLGPSGPYEFRRNVDDALQEKIETGILYDIRAGHDFFSFISIR